MSSKKREKVNTLRHFLVFCLTILILSFGFVLGILLESSRVNKVYTDLQKEDLIYQNSQSQINYLSYIIDNDFSKNKCELLRNTYFLSIENLEESRKRLEGYQLEVRYKEDEYQRLLSHYSNLQLDYYIVAKKISKTCDLNFDTILFFYSNDKGDCNLCQNQGTHLSYVKKKLKTNILIFSFNKDFDISSKIILEEKNLTKSGVPILIINDKIYNFLESKKIFEILEN